MLNTIRNSRVTKVIAFLLIVEMLTGDLLSHKLFALTSGPSQPEATSFQQASITDLVDPFTGDFSYNIPVMEIGGYPLNLSYASGIGMDQEATWAGLGWNLNTGAIVRNMRGLPDDFNGDEIQKDFNIKKNETYGVNIGLGAEFFGAKVTPGVSYGIEASYNNYTGFALSQSFNPSIGAAKTAKTNWNVNLGLTSSSNNGFTIAPGVSFSGKLANKNAVETKGSLGLGLSMNSRTGMGSLSLSGSCNTTFHKGKPSISYKAAMAAENGKSGRVAAGYAVGGRFGASLSFATPTYSPQIQYPMKNHAFTFNGMIGIAGAGADVDVKFGGFYSSQTLTKNTSTLRAFGYLNSEGGQNGTDVMHDFTREKDGGYTPKTTTKLPITNYTYDIYQIQAQGLEGSIRPFRNDASYIHDYNMVSPSTSGSGGFEISTTQVIDGGINVSVNSVKTESGIWKKNNVAKNNMPFRSQQVNKVEDKVHFRMSGEKTVDSDMAFYNATGGDNAVRFGLDKAILDKTLVNEDAGINTSFSGNISRGNRQNRVSSVEYLSVDEVKTLYPYRAKKYFSGVDALRYLKGHHVAQITVVKPDGSRYVFGLPGYNLTQQEITFAVGLGFDNNISPVPDAGNNVSYGEDDNSIGNKKGLDNRYDKTTIPAYVHTWYLTEVLSADYVDVTGDGPSEDDLGTYTVFEYGVEDGNGHNFPNIPKYKWRTPTATSPNKAGYNKNLHTDKYDDSANIVYGEKQVWYVSKIKSKTQVCVFSLSNRDDGYGVTGVDGGVAPANPLQKIDSISLYAKEDWMPYEESGYTSAAPLAVKRVHFSYNYSLCDGVPNNINSEGKLTLKSVWFTFEKAGRAKYSPYTFDYSDPVVTSDFTNPSYDARANDRWSNYKPEDPGLPNVESPYTIQEPDLQNKYAQAWSLQKVGLPSGGLINVEYESDDYAYVQNRQACSMANVVGFATDTSDTTPLTYIAPFAGDDYLTLFFKLQTPVAIASKIAAKDYVRKKYFTGLPGQTNTPAQKLYFRFYINVGSSSEKEYVSGYAEINSNSVSVSDYSGGGWQLGCVKLQGVQLAETGDYKYNPISKSAIQFSRMQTPTLAFHQTPPTDNSIDGVMNTLANAGFLKNLIEFFTGVNSRLRDEGVGRYFDVDKSWIRLIDPDGVKLGGGHRVSSITINDNWAALTNNKETGSFTYGQEYEYKNDDGTSSGVAAWEPVMGADENPFRQPIAMDKKVWAAPDENLYIEEPLGECFFPGPSVGYCKVTVKNLQYENVTVNATGKIVHRFNTAKDFPTKVEVTDLEKKREKSSIGFSLIVNTAWDYISTTQGYCITTNDMHGKPASQSIYDQNGTLISDTKYEYRVDSEGDLDNNVKVIKPDGSSETKMIGVDYDFVADMRENQTRTLGGGSQINLALFSVGIIPVFIPTIYPDMTIERTRFRSATITKNIFKTGILKSTTVTDKGAVVKTENTAYDGRTGEVLITKVNNEYNSERYAVNYPSYWAYDRMGAAADNWGFWFKVTEDNDLISNVTGEFDLDNPIAQVLVPGDEVTPMNFIFKTSMIATGNSANSNRLWVAEDIDGSNNVTRYLIKWDGSKYIPEGNEDLYFKVVRSGRRNMQTASIGSAEVLEYPIVGDVLNIDGLKALNVSAQEFSEHWRTKVFRKNTQGEATMTCGANAKGTRLIMLLNDLIRDDKFVRNFSLPIPEYEDINLSTYNLTGLIPASSCNYYYTSVATGYTPPTPFNTTAGLDDNAWMKLVFTPENYECNTCNDMGIVSISPQSEFTAADFDHVAYFSSVISIHDYLALTGDDPYLYLIDNPDDVFISRAKMTDGTTRDFIFYSNCSILDIGSVCCPVNEAYSCDPEQVNPYLVGVLGNWRPVKGYTYLTNRTPADVATTVDRRTGGHFMLQGDGGYFWLPPDTEGEPWLATTDLNGDGWRWAWTAEITNYNNAGGESENVNPLNIYSSAVFGYKQTLPIMVAQNAKYKEIGFDGFEDYLSLLDADTTCIKEHFKVNPVFWNNVTGDDKHTGRYSYRYRHSDDSPVFSYVTSPAQDRRIEPNVPYLLVHNDKLTSFSPDDGVAKKFILSFWVKKDDEWSINMPTYAGIDGKIDVDGSPITMGTPKKSPVIDGWQQFEYEITIPSSSADAIEIYFESDGGDYFIDDVRIHPFDATAKSFVYNSRNLRFMAELDENNYATFYEYDEEGALIRVKKETERGIITLKENRNRTYKRNP